MEVEEFLQYKNTMPQSSQCRHHSPIVSFRPHQRSRQSISPLAYPLLSEIRSTVVTCAWLSPAMAPEPGLHIPQIIAYAFISPCPPWTIRMEPGKPLHR